MDGYGVERMDIELKGCIMELNEMDMELGMEWIWI